MKIVFFIIFFFQVEPQKVSRNLEVLHRIYMGVRQKYGMEKISFAFSFYLVVGKLIQSQILTQSYPSNYLYLT